MPGDEGERTPLGSESIRRRQQIEIRRPQAASSRHSERASERSLRWRGNRALPLSHAATCCTGSTGTSPSRRRAPSALSAPPCSRRTAAGPRRGAGATAGCMCDAGRAGCHPRAVRRRGLSGAYRQRAARSSPPHRVLSPGKAGPLHASHLPAPLHPTPVQSGPAAPCSESRAAQGRPRVQDRACRGEGHAPRIASTMHWHADAWAPTLRVRMQCARVCAPRARATTRQAHTRQEPELQPHASSHEPALPHTSLLDACTRACTAV
jgi:hypothetical protein